MTLRVSDVTVGGRTGSLPDAAVRAKNLLSRVPKLFFWMVIAPFMVAAVYFLFLASPIYTSQAQFIVRAPTEAQPTGLGAVLQGVGLAPASTDSFAVHDFIMSRDAIVDLVRHHDLKAVLSRPEGDLLTRFPGPFQNSSIEELAKVYPRFVSVEYNSGTGISTLKVKAFRAGDAEQIAAALLVGGENVVNHLNDQAASDAIAESSTEITEAEAQLARAEQNLTSFRNRAQLIDPARSSGVNLDLLTKIEGELATLRAERAGVATAAPKSPDLPMLDDRIQAYQKEADDQRAQMAGQTGSLAPLIGEYERLSLERDFADKALSTAAASAEQARLEARRKRLYLERIVNPTLPDAATEPERLRALATVLVSLLLIYGITSLLVAGFREHRQS